MAATPQPRTPHPHVPNHVVRCVPSPKWVRAMFAGAIVAESTRALLVCETRHTPVYYFPREDVRFDLLAPTGDQSHCPFKGDASYFTLWCGGKYEENVAWSYETPLPGVEALAGHVAFYFGRLHGWYEEGEEIQVHPKNPFVRLDVLESPRPVRVVLGGETVAESSRALWLFETGLIPRYYLPAEDVRTEWLRPSEHQTRCPYKGTAHYNSVEVGGTLHENVVWHYPEPLAEVGRIAGRYCFYNEKMDELWAGGENRVTDSHWL